MMTLALDEETKVLLMQCIRESNGKEICGFLLAKENTQEFHLAPNFSSGKFSFFISDLDFVRIKHYALKNNFQIAALVHSHISTLNLSEEDINCLTAADLPWIVVMLGENAELLSKTYHRSEFLNSLPGH